MIDAALREHLASGPGLIVGTVCADGSPHASRGWGTRPLDDPCRIVVYLDPNDTRLLDNLRRDPVMAVTSADVLTYHSVQFKGVMEALAPATAEESAEAAAHVRLMAEKIHAIDHLPLEGVLNWMPPEFVACTMRIDTMFDQTPGPRAGTAFGSPGPEPANP